VTVFENGPEPISAAMRQMLKDAGITQAGRPVSLEYSENTVTVKVDGGRIELDVLYPALGCQVRSELATVLGAECTEKGNLKVNGYQQTTVECLYAAGDVVSDLHQLAVAIGHAAIAATDIHNRLKRNLR
jgi:thioredoxin reductase (NADPH)